MCWRKLGEKMEDVLGRTSGSSRAEKRTLRAQLREFVLQPLLLGGDDLDSML